MTTCPTCGHPSPVVLLPELAAIFDDGKPRKREAVMERGARLAVDLGLTVKVTDGTRWVLRVDLDQALGSVAA